MDEEVFPSTTPQSGCRIPRLQSHRSQSPPVLAHKTPKWDLETTTSPFAYSSDLKRLSKASHSTKNTDEPKLCLITPNFTGAHPTSKIPVAPSPRHVGSDTSAVAPVPESPLRDKKRDKKACLSTTANTLGTGSMLSFLRLFHRNCNLLCHRNI